MRATLVISWFLCSWLCAQDPLPDLLDRLRIANDAERPALLAALEQLGPSAGAAVPVLWNLLCDPERRKPASFEATLSTLIELLPFRAADALPNVFEAVQDLFRARVQQGVLTPPDADARVVLDRFQHRLAFPATADVATLIEALDARNALRVEAAVDVLGTKGAAARAALPALHALLERPEPRILLTERTISMHRKVARTVTAIAPDSKTAELARRVLAGAVPQPPEIVIPGRARSRIEELLRELAQPTTRELATANLVALGPVAALPVAECLSGDQDSEFVAAAIAVLDKLGPRAVDAVPAMLAALTALPATHAVALIGALARSAPWCTDVVPSLTYSASVGRIEVFGRRLKGNIDVALLNAFQDAGLSLNFAMSIDPGSSLTALEKLLVSSEVRMREYVITVLRERGSSARSVLPSLAAMLTAEQPPMHVSRWLDAATCRVEQVERTAEVQRLAAEAILGIAANDDPQVAEAKAVLARTQDK